MTLGNLLSRPEKKGNLNSHKKRKITQRRRDGFKGRTEGAQDGRHQNRAPPSLRRRRRRRRRPQETVSTRVPSDGGGPSGMLTKRKAFGNFRKKFDRTKKKKSGKHVRGRGVVFDPTRRVGGAHSEVISAISEVRTFFKTDLRKKKSRISQIRDSEFRVPRVPCTSNPAPDSWWPKPAN